MIPLSILCAVLVAVIAWQRSRLRDAMERGCAIEACATYDRAKARLDIDRSAALIATAHALLHDSAARAKDPRWLPWKAARDEWAAKCKGRES